MRDGRLEGVEVHDHQIDRRDAVRLGGAGVLGVAADGEQAAVDLGVQGLDAAVHHLGKAGVRGDVGHGDAGVLQGLGRAAGRQDLDAARASARPSSTSPVLSETEIRARRITGSGMGLASSTVRAPR